VKKSIVPSLSVIAPVSSGTVIGAIAIFETAVDVKSELVTQNIFFHTFIVTADSFTYPVGVAMVTIVSEVLAVIW